MKIRIQLVTTRDFVSWAIRHITRSQFSHAEFLLDDGTALGARKDGVTIKPWNWEKFTDRRVYSIVVSDTVGANILAIARLQVGKPYDYLAIVGRFINRDWREDDRWFCSELIAYCFETAGAPLLNSNVAVDRITPRDLELSPILVAE